MSSPCRVPNPRRCLGPTIRAALATMLVVAGQANSADTPADVPTSENGPLSVPTTAFPRGGSSPAEDSRVELYEGNTQAIAAGQQLFEWYNCAGCHLDGPGGAGPPLTAKQWIHGGRLDQIYAMIVQGHPSGMPSWGAIIPDNEIWEIAAFVKSLAASNPANAAGQLRPISPPPPQPPPSTRDAAPK
jgi:cytochrome c oxidase cbb3-type subunit III